MNTLLMITGMILFCVFPVVLIVLTWSVSVTFLYVIIRAVLYGDK
jgi:hypothetical protein